MNRLTLEQLDVRPGERVLEIGFGGGDLLQSLLRTQAQEIVGIDHSEDMVARAKRRLRQEVKQGRLRLLVGTAEALPPREGGFDKVCSVNTVYFWERPAAVLAELARATRRGGRLVLALQSPDSVRRWPGHVHGFRAYGADELAHLMESAGFTAPSQAAGHDEKVGDFLCLTSELK